MRPRHTKASEDQRTRTREGTSRRREQEGWPEGALGWGRGDKGSSAEGAWQPGDKARGNPCEAWGMESPPEVLEAAGNEDSRCRREVWEGIHGA